jgi:predicted DNA-binding transcriptional regulator AlpA
MAERMAEKNTEGLLTLSEVHHRTGISMPTLQRYKKLYQARIPSIGRGRKQRYPQSALVVFEQLKTENLGRRGRPRKGEGKAADKPVARLGIKSARRPGRPALNKGPVAAAAPVGRGRRKAVAPVAPSAPIFGAKKAGAKKSVAPKSEAKTSGSLGAKTGRKRSGLITLTEVAKKAGISYPTAVRYVREFIERLPHEGTGRTRRFYPTAIEAVRQLREESGRGGRKAVAAVRKIGRQVGNQVEGAVAAQIRDLQKTQKQIEEKIRGVVKALQKLLD